MGINKDQLTKILKIIISHDIDHLYPSDHIFRDFIFPKLWIRSFIEVIKCKITIKTWYNRLISVFSKRLNRIPEIIEFDRKNNIPSTFFFGMDNALGMSYKKKNAKSWIKYVLTREFDVGVHGVDFKDFRKMSKEFTDFKNISNLILFGIRTHYVRYDKDTFNKMADIGYLFDTSQYNKSKIELILPYKIKNMWEFPLYIMDSYIMKGNLDNAKQQTINSLNEAKSNNLEYFTFLFHDFFFNEKTYPSLKLYYEWFVNYCLNQGYGFISYKNAILSLNNKENAG